MAWDVAAMAWRRAKGLGVVDYVGRGGARVLDLLLVVGGQLVGDALLVIIKSVLHVVEIALKAVARIDALLDFFVLVGVFLGLCGYVDR